MKKIDLNENEVVFAPKDGKPGYIVNGKWMPVDQKDYNSPQLQRELDRYARLRGQEQLKNDQERLKSQNSTPVIPLKVEPPKDNSSTPDSTTPSTPDSTTPSTPSTSTPTSTPKIPTGVVVSPTTGEKTKFERRLPTTVELKAAQKARRDALAGGAKKGEAEYQAVKAGVAASKNPTTAVTGGVNPRSTMKQEAYDMVLDYLLSEGHVETIEEAHYVMLQMTSEHVQDIVEGVGYSNPSVGGKPVMNPKGHPQEGKPASFNKAETDGVNEYKKASKKAGRKIYADEPLPKK